MKLFSSRTEYSPYRTGDFFNNIEWCASQSEESRRQLIIHKRLRYVRSCEFLRGSRPRFDRCHEFYRSFAKRTRVYVCVRAYCGIRQFISFMKFVRTALRSCVCTHVCHTLHMYTIIKLILRKYTDTSAIQSMKSLYRVEFSKSRGNIFVGQSKAQLRGREERGAGNREINISSLKKDISDSNSSI